jgi:hypothetical protein
MRQWTTRSQLLLTSCPRNILQGLLSTQCITPLINSILNPKNQFKTRSDKLRFEQYYPGGYWPLRLLTEISVEDKHVVIQDTNNTIVKVSLLYHGPLEERSQICEALFHNNTYQICRRPILVWYFLINPLTTDSNKNYKIKFVPRSKHSTSRS